MTGDTARLRQSLQHQLITMLEADFQKHGAEVVTRLREKDPAGYLRAIAAAGADAPPLDTTWNDLTDAELSLGIAALKETIRAGADDDGGTRPQAGQAPSLSPLPETDDVP